MGVRKRMRVWGLKIGFCVGIFGVGIWDVGFDNS